jgi:membrane protein YqaA with SNARE-associated domain
LEAYLSLFAVSFLAATLLPAASEVLLSGLLLAQYDPLALWMTATLGNTLGSVFNYVLGRYLLHFQNRRWFPFAEDQMARSQIWFQRYGVWSLLFAWAPVFGDLLTFIAGVMRVHWLLFTLLVLVGKGLRYAFLLGVLHWFASL